MDGTSPADMDAFPALGNDAFLTMAAQLELTDLARALRVCRCWRAVLDGTESLWSGMCERAWASKVYVPASLRNMAKGEAGLADAQQAERSRLMAARIRELKVMMRNLHIPSNGLVEKSEITDAILDARRRRAAGVDGGDMTSAILNMPSLLVHRSEGESLPKAALRLSLVDASRNTITKEELQSLTFSVRLRNDGPLQQAMRYDPWWSGHGHGEASFQADGALTFHWPTDPDDEDGEATLDPFAAMGLSYEEGSIGYELDELGSIVTILFYGQHGPQEVVCRHPETWGWVLYSQGTCWTSWPMPPCVAGQCCDPLLREGALRELPSAVEREF